jgi:hypothetical protein
MRALAVAGLLVAALAAAAIARPPATPAPKVADPPPAAVVDIRIITRDGDMTHLKTEGDTIEYRLTTTSQPQRRSLTTAERQQLSRAARAAVKSGPGRRVCSSPHETFVSVTVDEKTFTDALCDRDFSGDIPYRAIVTLVRVLLLPETLDGGTAPPRDAGARGVGSTVP